MARVIALFVGTALVGGTMWLADASKPAQTASAGIFPLFSKGPSVQERLAEGKTLYNAGRFAEAVAVLQKVVDEPGSLKPAERADARNYLAAARREVAGQNTRPAQQSPAAGGTAPRYGLQADAASNRAFARDFLDRAHQYERQGDARSAIDLARRADALQVEWQPGEETPRQYLARLEQQSRPRDLGRPDTGMLVQERRNEPGREAPLASRSSRVPPETDPYQPAGAGEFGGAVRPASGTAGRNPFDSDELDNAFDEEDDALFTARRPLQPREPETSAAARYVRRPETGTQRNLLDSERNREASRLVAEARQALQQGRVQDARVAALEAQRLDAVYGTLDETPELLLEEIARSDRSNVLAEAGDTGRAASGGLGAPAEYRRAAPLDGGVAAGGPSPRSENNRVRKQEVLELLAEAREDQRAGLFDEARAKAKQAQKLGRNVAYGILEENPEMVLADIDAAERRAIIARTERQPLQEAPRGVRTPPQFAAADDAEDAGRIEPVRGIAPERGIAPGRAAADSLTAIRPEGPTALDSFHRGVALRQQGDLDGAYQAFQDAYYSGERLDPHTAQQLQDFLTDLTPRRRGGGIRTASAEREERIGPGDAGPRAIDDAEREQTIRYERHRTEALHAIFTAEKLRETDPDRALEALDQALASLEGAGLSEQAAASLVGQLQRTRTSIASYRRQIEPNLAAKRHAEEVKTEIERERKHQIKVEQELAELVDEFNKLTRERRYPEAAVVAQKARDLAPNNPVTTTLVWKSKMADRKHRYDEIRDLKENAIVDTYLDVDRASAPIVGDANPYVFDTKHWGDITRRRAGKYGASSRERTPTELLIEKSLNQKISLHFESRPLSEVMGHIATIADMNIVLDTLGLEEEAIDKSHPVSINVDGIMLRSALNLLLEPMHLTYTVKDEVLKITSRMRQQGELITDTYSVADLVVPIPNFQEHNPFAASTLRGTPHMSVPSGGGLARPRGAAHMDVSDAIGGMGGGPFRPPYRSGPELEASLSGGGAAVDFDALTELIVSTVEPGSWVEVGGHGTVLSFETTLSLVVRQTQTVHDEIADLLGQLRRLQDLQVTVEVRFVTVTDRFFERIGVDFDFNVQDTLQGASPPGSPGNTGQDNFPKGGTIVGLSSPTEFTQDGDIAFRQGSFDIGVPDFGGFNPEAGIQVGMAILSDIEAFLFIQAAQGDERSNIMFAPKVTLFNGQSATVSSNVSRPFVISVQPTVGVGAVGFTPIIQNVNEGVQLTVQAVISADRRFVRLTALPQFNNITDVFTFTFQGGLGGGLGGIGGGLGGGLAGLGGGLAGLGGGLAGLGGGLAGLGGGLGGLGGGLGGLGGGGLGGLGGGGLGGLLGGAGGFFSVQDSMNASPMVGFGGIGGIGGITGTTGTTGGTGGALGGAGGLAGAGGTAGGGGIGGGGTGGGGGAGSVTVQQPVQEQVTVQTTVSVPDGGTVLLGGVKRLREGRNMAGVPILNKIPYISRLFKNSGVGRETESLILMVTPRIIIQEEEEELLLGIPLEP
ncbi:MAG: hypothetical protein WD069_06045 [Planctomycetales bacterium]